MTKSKEPDNFDMGNEEQMEIYSYGFKEGKQEAKKEFFGKVKKILKQMKEDRQMHPVNINDWNDGYGNCLDIYIKELEELEGEIKGDKK